MNRIGRLLDFRSIRHRRQKDILAMSTLKDISGHSSTLEEPSCYQDAVNLAIRLIQKGRVDLFLWSLQNGP
ncbi:hypothetical protein HBI56_110250 [Parastagonospora nodorum]|uniref:Uncharacterized protein n=1 Tax=Phaeosphaeria nodorum (strain SN15 / ATCC MYA-4574 / FGSC 10173) TaxID=321614 RepID=A0A7U2EU95_PHANO|nr:hypothetical protein HBH56_042770 [Parastagonospora nodorum]QRC92901.1 hypothetical protein JI435_305710 [Parastagonospora nodorum SN15]KAH3933069.1 hypothetical protein HBH54_070520 [Parastagonospora nodorum]KAH3943384.1 hypothetical protein HBH53_174700 [Parastagonospora nodorum]KAH3973086.1 hypothetical protein HBH52_142680 [Parastagonospora nodorum]